MKKAFVLLLAGLLVSALGAEDQPAKPKTPSVVFAPNFFGPIFGFYSGVVDFDAGPKATVDTEFGYFNIKAIPIIGSQISASSDFWFGYAKAGPTFYLDQAFHGLYVGVYGLGNFFYIGSSSGNLQAGAVGGGAKLGWRGTWDWFSLALGGGYEYAYAFASVSSSDSTVNGLSASVSGGHPYATLELAFAVY